MDDSFSQQIKRIRAIYGQDQRITDLHGNWALLVLCRPLGFRVAAFAMRHQITPTRITLLCAVLAPLMPLAAWALGGVAGACAVALIGWGIQVLDCADGDLARATDQVTKLGGDLDMLGDIWFFALLYLAIGILAMVQSDQMIWLFFAIAAAWVRLYARTIRDRCATAPTVQRAPPRGTGQTVSAAMQGIDGLLPPLALGVIWGPWPAGVLLLISLVDLWLSAGAVFKRKG
jgi:phosphatidylglycerophosphate synthase